MSAIQHQHHRNISNMQNWTYLLTQMGTQVLLYALEGFVLLFVFYIFAKGLEMLTNLWLIYSVVVFFIIFSLF